MKDVKKIRACVIAIICHFRMLCKYSSFCVLQGYKLIFYLYVTIVKNCNESAVNNLLNFKIWQKLTSAAELSCAQGQIVLLFSSMSTKLQSNLFCKNYSHLMLIYFGVCYCLKVLFVAWGYYPEYLPFLSYFITVVHYASSYYMTL